MPPAKETMRTKHFAPFALFAWLVMATPALSATDLDYTAARALAEKHESALNPEQTQALILSQGDVGGRALADCRLESGGILADLSPFTVVLELDATGKVMRTWREGESPIATCFEKTMQAQSLAAPPQAPFYTYFAMSWDD